MKNFFREKNGGVNIYQWKLWDERYEGAKTLFFSLGYAIVTVAQHLLNGILLFDFINILSTFSEILVSNYTTTTSEMKITDIPGCGPINFALLSSLQQVIRYGVEIG